MFSRLAPALTLVLPLVNGQFNNPPGVDIWCGKAYRETYVLSYLSSGIDTNQLTSVEMRLLTQVVGSKNRPSRINHWWTSKSSPG